MLYCPGKGHELLSALGARVTVVCHASNVFLVLKVPLSLVRDRSLFSWGGGLLG